eukprot:gene7969-9363_t
MEQEYNSLNSKEKLTIVSYLGLNTLKARYGDDLVVLGFPCAQFFNQEPGTDDEILSTLQHVRPGNGYVPAFPLFKKIIVNGEGTDPIFLWLKQGCPNPCSEIANRPISWTPVAFNDITWNFEKVDGIFDKDTKIIYRHYATLYFVFVVDSSESELSMIDLIQTFVETLDKCFENVCELDLIFHIDKVHYILDEIVMGGLVLETNPAIIVSNYDTQNKLEKSENPLVAGFQGVLQTIKPK